jgi:hypothetical protein
MVASGKLLQILIIAVIVFGLCCAETGHTNFSGGSPATEASSDRKADEFGGTPQEVSTQAGINWSRYRAATAGCIGSNDEWNEYCSIVNPRDAIEALKETGITKVKLFAPGSFPEEEYNWYFPMWKEDLIALSQSPYPYELFIGIPNSELFSLAGITFAMTCGSEVLNHSVAAAHSGQCGTTEKERIDAILLYTFELLESHIDRSVHISISCSPASDNDSSSQYTFNSSKEAFLSGHCTPEEINSVLAQALVESPNFMADIAGVASWFERHFNNIVDESSSIQVKHIGVGNEPFAPWYHDFYDAIVLAALKKSQAYLDTTSSAALASATVTIPFAGCYASEPVLIEQVLGYLKSIQSVFVQNIYPHVEVFNYAFGRAVSAQLKTYQRDLLTWQDLDQGVEYDSLYINQEDLTWIKDFIAWGVGRDVSAENANTWNTQTFYESYVSGYKVALKSKSNGGPFFNNDYSALQIISGETGWPDYNDVIYYTIDTNGDYVDTNQARKLGFDDLVFNETLEAEDEDGKVIIFDELAKVGYKKFRQIVSNEVFNRTSAHSFIQTTVAFWNAHGMTGYLFELLDEAHKRNEAENMAFELERYFGIYEVAKDDNGELSLDSQLKPKFFIDFRATR